MADGPKVTDATAWKVYKRVEPEVSAWLAGHTQQLPIHAFEFIPHSRFLEVYVFFETDADVAQANESGLSREMQTRFVEAFDAHGFGPGAGIPIRFEFDSHENVVKNYQGSYSFRLR